MNENEPVEALINNEINARIKANSTNISAYLLRTEDPEFTKNCRYLFALKVREDNVNYIEITTGFEISKELSKKPLQEILKWTEENQEKKISQTKIPYNKIIEILKK